MVKLFQLLCPVIVLSATVLEYRFGLNFGQVFYDFSNNGHYAVNGLNSSIDSWDAPLTDRGLYMWSNYCNNGVTLPPNDQTSSISLSLPSSFSIISWVLSYDYSKRPYFTAFNSTNSNNMTIHRLSDWLG
jgi:hypothetical protein